MPILIYDTAHSIHSTVTDTAQPVALGTTGERLFAFNGTIGAWIKQGASDVAATAGDDSMYVPAGKEVIIVAKMGTHLSVLRAGGANGDCSITPVTVR